MNPSSSLFSPSSWPIVELGDGIFLFTKMKIASSGLSSIRFLTTKTKCPIVRSDGTKNFCLSMAGSLHLGSLSTITGIWPAYLWRIDSASFFRSSNDLPCLYFEVMRNICNALFYRFVFYVNLVESEWPQRYPCHWRVLRTMYWSYHHLSMNMMYPWCCVLTLLQLHRQCSIAYVP